MAVEAHLLAAPPRPAGDPPMDSIVTAVESALLQSVKQHARIQKGGPTVAKCPECGLEDDRRTHKKPIDCRAAWGEIAFEAAMGLMIQVINGGDCPRNEKGWPVFEGFQDRYSEACLSLALQQTNLREVSGQPMKPARPVAGIDLNRLRWKLKSKGSD
jgi:hypothetical protein